MTNEIVVVGLAGRFPGAPNTDEFWEMLAAGRSGMVRLSPDEMRQSEVPEAVWARSDYVPVWAGIEEVDRFASDFFGVPAADAEVLDPQQRLLLETSWHALEDAGLDPTSFDGKVGVFAGVGFNTYLVNHLLPHAELVERVGRFVLSTANDKDNAAARLAYKLDLRGPSMTLQTNCSTGLIAVHQAAAALSRGECDAALVAAASIKAFAPEGYLCEPGGTLSRSGVCRAFDSQADGFVIGDGVAAVVLRRQVDVRATGDRVYCVLKGSAINNDGSSKVSFSATSKAAQVSVIEAALMDAEVSAESVSYVEANGSATPMGDAIELAALAQVYGSPDRKLRIGSLKPSIGNLDTVSGLASFIKATLSLYNGTIPPTLNFVSSNAHSPQLKTSLSVVTEPVSWDGLRRDVARIGVSSFAVGGANAHMILERVESLEPRASSGRPQLLTLSAKSADELRNLTDEVSRHLEVGACSSLDDAATTLLVGRRRFEHRVAVISSSLDGAAAALRRASPRVAGRTSSWAVSLAEEVDAALVDQLSEGCPDFDHHHRSAIDEVGTRALDEPLVQALVAQLAVVRTLETWGLRPAAINGSTIGPAVAAIMSDPRRLPAAVAQLVSDQSSVRDHRSIVTGSISGAQPRSARHVEVVVVVGAADRPPEEWPEAAVIQTAKQARGSVLLGVAAELWSRGFEVEASRLSTGARTRLPGYPFERKPHWIAADAKSNGFERASGTYSPGGASANVTPLEAAVASIWLNRLGGTSVGLDDSFLDLGGDSLKATQILASIGDDLHVDLSLREFLEAPTIRALAIAVKRNLITARGALDHLDALNIAEASADDRD